MMRYFILLILIGLSGCSSVKESYPEHPNYSLIVEQSGYYSSTNSKGQKREQYGLRFRLNSNYDTLPSIYLMKCSWTNWATSSNDKIYLGTPCDANFMWMTSIRSDEYLELNTIAQASRSHENFDLTQTTFKVGLILIDTLEISPNTFLFFGINKEEKDEEKFYDSLKKQSKRLVWSNEVKLKRLIKSEPLPWGSWEIKKKSQ